MATIAEQLTSLANTKSAIKNAIVAKGISVADTDPFSAYADKIGQISGGGGEPIEEWQPNPNWWDIKKILDEDTRDYAGKVGVIMYNLNDVSEFELTSFGLTAVATSDGAFYTYADNGKNVSHNWDTTQDKDDGYGLKTRWVIYYYAKDTIADTFAQTDRKFGWAYNYIAYMVLRINCSNASYFCQNQRFLEAIDNVGYSISGTNFSSFCIYCYALQKLPDVLDTSSCTNLYSFCQHCCSLQKLPDVFDTSNCTNFSYFCANCPALRKLPDVLDTSKGTNFSYFIRYCILIQKLPDVFDTSSGTNFSYFCANCYALRKLPDVLDTSKATTVNEFCESCYSLQELPDVLDTSSATNFNYFCAYCSSLQKSSNVLDTSKGTTFNNFFSGCVSLLDSPEVTFSANTSNYTSKYSAPFNNAAWIKYLPLTLPSNTNFWIDSSTRISIESFRYIADHAPDVTATPRTLTVGSTNIARINEADPTIITDLNAKGWTVA